MKVNDIQIYNNAPDFRALILKKGAEKHLFSMPDKVLNKLDLIGEKLKDTKHYNMYITKEECFIAHTDGERMYLPIIVNNVGKLIIIKARQGISQFVKKLNYNNTKKVREICDRIKQPSTQLERTAEIAKVLDEYEEKSGFQEQCVFEEKHFSREELIPYLMKKYGVNS